MNAVLTPRAGARESNDTQPWPMLELERFTLRRRGVAVLDEVSLTLAAGQTLALIGESGAGKSTLAYAAMGLVRPPEVVFEGRLAVGDCDVGEASEKTLRTLRGSRIGMIFQDASAALNPCFTVLQHLSEPLRRHRGLRGADCRRRAVELLAQVGIGDPAGRLSAYPHELSGGMQQRVMIAIALACEPRLLIADEPTSALDVTIQAQIMALILERVRALGASAVFVLHDLALATQVADRVAVMYAGQIVEEGPVREVLGRPRHPYTRGLRASAIEFGAERLAPIAGVVPPLSAMPAGCRFAPRCGRASAQCSQRPQPLSIGGVRVACWHP
ncbi:ABC transporter ATP-binding protein [Rubrivivax gelatinosus]|uniref:Peptide ABC transporter ATP-binding protein n=1 Tax=Rubrivivax gelatinosus TaxID=28068 RepID=A0ABS1DYK1_RUBGE|nr:ABC transporter ATP-binding protein [Rubrivivax gelatinosus]MBK1715167.1 peptide ABC transporter ATP-binding protein [Rubrivivax gelatinosus]